MIHVKAGLVLDSATQQMLEDTLAEFARCCEWAHAQAPADALDMHMLRGLLYNQLRHQTQLGGTLCSLVFSAVAAYRRATLDMVVVQDAGLCPQKLVYYSNGITLKGSQVNVLMLQGRKSVAFELNKPGDSQLLQTGQLRRADLQKSEAGTWEIDFHMAPTQLTYTPDRITYGIAS
ncbi:MAG: hypothetical protein ACO1RX_20075 [Candidatus Sericytochromatia bacterium]